METGFDYEKLYEEIRSRRERGEPEPSFEKINPNIEILQDWVGNNIGLLIGYAELGDHLDLNTPVVQKVLTEPVEYVLQEKDGLQTYGEKVGHAIDPKVLDYINYLRSEIQYLVSNVVDPEAQAQEFWDLVNETRTITTLDMIPSDAELDQRKRAAA